MSFDLLECVRDGDLQRTKELLATGADPNIRDVFSGSTCIHAAVATEDVEILKTLLENGANPNIPTQNTDASPLGVAALNGMKQAVIVLLSHGARLSDRDVETGLLEECIERGYGDVAILVENRTSQ